MQSLGPGTLTIKCHGTTEPTDPPNHIASNATSTHTDDTGILHTHSIRIKNVVWILTQALAILSCRAIADLERSSFFLLIKE